MPSNIGTKTEQGFLPKPIKTYGKNDNAGQISRDESGTKVIKSTDDPVGKLAKASGGETSRD